MQRIKKLTVILLALSLSFTNLQLRTEIKALAKTTNLLSIGSFEEGESIGIDDTTVKYSGNVTKSTAMETVTIKDTVARTGSNSLYIVPKMVASYPRLVIGADLVSGKWYKISAYFRLDADNETKKQNFAWSIRDTADTNLSMYCDQNSDDYKYYASLSGTGTFTPSGPTRVKEITADDWTEISTIFKAPEADDGKVKIGFTHCLQTGTTGKNMYYIYMDDISLVEVTPTVTFNSATASIPAFEEDNTVVDFKVMAGGKELSYEKNNATFTLADEYKGVSIKDNKLIITDEAISGDVEVNFTNSVSGMSGSGTLTLEAQSDTPEVRNLKIAKENGTLKADYTFYDPNGKTNASIYEWLYSADDISYVTIEDADEITFTPSDGYENGYIKVKVTPKNNEGIDNSPKTSDSVYGRDVAPTISDAEITGKLCAKEELTLKYKFSDLNGDSEGTSEFAWYRCDENGENHVLITGATTENYTLTTDDIGHYITASIIPKSVNPPDATDEFFAITPVGPIDEEDTNMVENAGFEDETKLNGTTYDSVYPSGSGGTVLTMNTDAENVHSGEYSLKVSQTTGQYQAIAFKPTVKTNTLYEFSLWVKLDKDSVRENPYIYSADTTVFLPDFSAVSVMNAYGTSDSKTELSRVEWTQIKRLFYCKGADGETTTANFDLRTGSWASSGSFICYIDDLYISEAFPKIEIVGSSYSAEVPKTNQPAIKEAFVPKVVTKKGNNFVLADKNITISPKEEYKGVSVENNVISISDEAYEREIILKASYDEYNLSFDIPYMLTYSQEAVPEVRNLVIKGELTEGATLEAKYDFYHGKGNEEGASTYVWYYSDNENGPYSPIENAAGKTYPVSTQQLDGYIKVSVTPKDISGVSGTTQTSPAALKPVAPYADNITVSGKHFVDETLTASYKFNDKNFNDEANSIYQWYRSDSENGSYSLIENANSLTYKLTADDCNKYLKFSVIPVSSTEPTNGAEAFSVAFEGPVKPTVSNIQISGTKSAGSILTVTYDYYHKYGAPEGETVAEWYCGDTKIHTGFSYTVSSSYAGKSIYVKIIPVSQKMPYEGVASSSSSVTISSGNGGGGSGGGFGGGGISRTDEKKEDKTENETSTPVVTGKTPFADANSHWAEDTIEKMYKAGYVNGVSDVSFEPDRSINRAEFCTLLCRAFEINGADNAEFKDVSEKDWYYSYVNSAAAAGIVQGADGCFNPVKEITRQEMAMMMLNLLNYKEYELPEGTEVSFADSDDIDSWAKDAVSVLAELDLLKGSDGNYRPLFSATRAEAAVVLDRLITLFNN